MICIEKGQNRSKGHMRQCYPHVCFLVFSNNEMGVIIICPLCRRKLQLREVHGLPGLHGTEDGACCFYGLCLGSSVRWTQARPRTLLMSCVSFLLLL